MTAVTAVDGYKRVQEVHEGLSIDPHSFSHALFSRLHVGFPPSLNVDGLRKEAARESVHKLLDLAREVRNNIMQPYAYFLLNGMSFKQNLSARSHLTRPLCPSQ